MNKKKILTLVLCGTMIFSATGVSTAAEGVSGFKTGKEKILTELSVRVRDNTQERVRKMSSLVKAAVQIARSEEEARKAAEAAAAEEKAKQEAEEKARKEKAEAEERAKKETEKAKQKIAETTEAAVPAEETETQDFSEPVSFVPDYSYSEETYYEPVYDVLYADAVPYDYSYAADAAYEDVIYTAPAYEEPSYVEPVYEEPVYEEPVYQEPVYEEPVYQEPVYEEPVYEEPVYEEPVYEEASYYDDSLYTDYSGSSYEDTAYYGEDAYADEYSEDAYTDEGVRAVASDSDLDLLASIIYCEAGGESYEGQVAVGAVVLNRMDSSLYPDDMTDVIYQSGQFTPAMTGWLDQVRESGVPDYCYDAAQAALNGENPVGDCLYFHAGGGDGLTIGNQTFY